MTTDTLPLTTGRLCIGCIHLYYQPHFVGYMGSEWTGRYGEEDAALLCQRDHWRKELGGGDPIPVIDIAQGMLKAATCEDYEEREVAP